MADKPIQETVKESGMSSIDMQGLVSAIYRADATLAEGLLNVTYTQQGDKETAHLELISEGRTTVIEVGPKGANVQRGNEAAKPLDGLSGEAIMAQVKQYTALKMPVSLAHQIAEYVSNPYHRELPRVDSAIQR